MKNTDITKIRHLTREIRLFLRGLQNMSPLLERAMVYEAKTDEILALLPCETCNGTKQVPTPQSIGFGKENEIMDTCPDCESRYRISDETSDTDVDSASKYCEKHGVFYGVGQSCPVCKELDEIKPKNEYTKGELKQEANQIVPVAAMGDGKTTIAVFGDTVVEKAEANAKELIRRWNAFEKDGLVDELLVICADAKKFLAQTIIPMGVNKSGTPLNNIVSRLEILISKYTVS